MSLSINYVVAHQLKKEQKNKSTTLKISKDLLDPNDVIVVQMVSEINSVYGKKQNYVQYGSFVDTAYDTPKKFKTYFDKDGEKSKGFKSLTEDLMTNFQTAASGKIMATGGYIIFADFVVSGLNQFLIAMVKDKSGISFDNALKPKSIERIDLEKLHQAFKINFKSYNDFNSAPDDEKDKFNYLSFISKVNKTSEYFVDALSSQVGNSSSKATSELIDAVFDFSKEKFNSGFFNKKAADVKEALSEYMHEIGDGELINLENVKAFLGRFVDPSSEEASKSDEIIDDFISSLNSEDHLIPYEFAVSIKEVNRKGRISIKAKKWDMKFDRKLLGANHTDVIYYNKENGKLTIDVSDDRAILNQLDTEIEELNSTIENQSEVDDESAE